MPLFVAGLSHKTAPVEVRERLTVPEDGILEALAELSQLPDVTGVFAVSTCNRFEVYGSSPTPEQAARAVVEWMTRRGTGRGRGLERHLYTHAGEQAVSHLFRVTSSLDSMVVGEAQILGQMKVAYATADELGTVDGFLRRSFNQALRAAKKVRSGTAIARNAVSVPQVSVQLARKIFGNLKGRVALVIGAGEMAEIAARNLRSQGVSEMHVANRTLERAQTVAEALDAQAHRMSHLPTLLSLVDIVITSTGSQDHVLRRSQLARVMPRRRYRPLFIIDIAVPRDVEPSVGDLENIYLFDIDDLGQVVETNLKKREAEARDADAIVEREAEMFFGRLRAEQAKPTIVRLRTKLTRMKDEELERALGRLPDLDDTQRERVARLANTLVNRILHEPSVALKKLAREGEIDGAVDIIHTLFQLDAAEEEPPDQ